MMTNLTPEQKHAWAHVVGNAWADAEYKARLLAHPAAVLKEAGVELPPGLRLRVVENTADVTHLVLPAEPPGTPRAEVEERVSAMSVVDCFGCCSSAGCEILLCVN